MARRNSAWERSRSLAVPRSCSSSQVWRRRADRHVATPQAAAMTAPTPARTVIPTRSPAMKAMTATTSNQPAATPRATASERVKGGGGRMVGPIPTPWGHSVNWGARGSGGAPRPGVRPEKI